MPEQRVYHQLKCTEWHRNCRHPATSRTIRATILGEGDVSTLEINQYRRHISLKEIYDSIPK